ncbi:MAG: class I SAM-dependent methyltransferase [candidate division Zixibacteria bacterium]|nr:class I SAM-dependent methyltransferase [candidate division Zixibacteria bacterium]
MSYLEDILIDNKRMNLVSRETSIDHLIQIVGDCLAPFELLPALSKTIFDIGPGAGLPSVVLLLAFPGVRGVLFERNGKKAAFLEKMIYRYQLPAEIKLADFVSVADSFPIASFDWGFMRYVKLNKKIVQKVSRILTPAGRFIHYSQFYSSSDIIPGNMKKEIINYYIDNQERVHSLTIFSHQI